MFTQKLAEMIYSVAQYDGYNTSILQTERNLSTSNQSDWEFAREQDRYIFEDLLRAIRYASKQEGVSVDVIKEINAQMFSKKEGQPMFPGKLRKNYSIHVGDYVPPETITEEMVGQAIQSVQGRDIASAWELYAKLAKLQAFDNGNKRTSFIAANLLIGALHGKTEDFLKIPTDFRRTQFDANLMYYYMSDDWDEHLPDEQESLEQFVSFASKYTASISNVFK